MMGVAAGSALAGPGALRDAAEASISRVPIQGLTKVNYADGAKDCVGVDPEWTLRQLAKAKRLAAGDFRDEDRNHPTEGSPDPYRALRSVSANAQHFMRAAHYERQWRERTIKQAREALDQYDKMGIIRTLF